jgi:TP901 family phage tail tape measure protein
MAKSVIEVQILGQAKSLISALEGADSKLGGFAGSIAKAGLAVGGLAIGAAVGLEQIGSSFDKAMDGITVKTGATGPQLDALGDSFKNIVKTVPVDFGEAADAIGGLNQKLGLSGKPLEDLTTQILNLSRITDTDLNTNIDAASNLFNSWGVAAEDQGPKLDELFKISQKTGISVGDLAGQMADGGVQFREAGLTFEDTGSLLGLLAKNGLTAGDVLPALSKAMATAAKDGKPANEVFRDTFDAIKNAPNDTKAAGIALDVFGAKAGPKFAALIREGKLSYEEMTAAVAGSDETINAAATRTDDWQEKLKLLVNKAMVALEPVATKVFGAMATAMDAIPGILEWMHTAWDAVVSGFSGSGSEQSGVLGFLQKMGAAIGVVVNWVKDNWPQIKAIATGVFQAFVKFGKLVLDDVLIPLGKALKTAFSWLMDNKEFLIGIAIALGAVLVTMFVGWAAGAAAAAVATIAAMLPMVALVAAVAAVAGGIIYAYNHFQVFHDVVDAIGRFFRDDFVPILKTIYGFINDNIIPVIAVLVDIWLLPLKLAFKAVSTLITDVFIPAFELTYSFIKDKLIPIFESIISTAISISTTVGTVVGEIVGFITGIPGKIGTVIATMWDGLKTGITGARDWVSGRVDDVINFVTGIPGRIAMGVSDIFGGIKTAMTGAKDWVSDRIDDIVNFATGLPGRMVGLFVGMWDGIKNAFKSALNTIIGWWNDLDFTFPGYDIPGPGPNIPGFTIGLPDIPKFHQGGIVPGYPGEEVMILAKAGEQILTSDQQGGGNGMWIDKLYTGNTTAETIEALRRTAWLEAAA